MSEMHAAAPEAPLPETPRSVGAPLADASAAGAGGGDAGAPFDLASVARRHAADDVDLLLAVVIFLTPWVAFFRAAALTGEDEYWLGFILGLFFFVTIPAFFLHVLLAMLLAFFVPAAVARGRTVGATVFGTAVVGADGTAPGVAQLLRREWSRAWRVALVVPGFRDREAARSDGLRRTHHDRAAGTVVVRAQRTPVRATAACAAAAGALLLASVPGLLAARAWAGDAAAEPKVVTIEVGVDIPEALDPGAFSTPAGVRPRISLVLGAGWTAHHNPPDAVLERDKLGAYLAFTEHFSGLTLDDAIRTIEAVDGLQVRDVDEARIGGRPAKRVTLAVPSRQLELYERYNLERGNAYHLYVVGVDSKTVMVIVEAPVETFDAFAREAEDALATLTFHNSAVAKPVAPRARGG
jgi:uncharacterized RDD family membrane protein YckC